MTVRTSDTKDSVTEDSLSSPDVGSESSSDTKLLDMMRKEGLLDEGDEAPNESEDTTEVEDEVETAGDDEESPESDEDSTKSEDEEAEGVAAPKTSDDDDEEDWVDSSDKKPDESEDDGANSTKQSTTESSDESIHTKRDAQTRIRQLVTEVKEHKRDAELARTFRKQYTDVGIKDESMEHWIGLALTIQSNPAAALPQLDALREALAKQAGVAEDSELPAEFAQLVEDGEMTETAARSLLRRNVPQYTPPSVVSFKAPQYTEEDVKRDMSEVAAEYEAKHKALWNPKLVEEANAELKRRVAEVTDLTGTPPLLEKYRELADQALAATVKKHSNTTIKSNERALRPNRSVSGSSAAPKKFGSVKEYFQFNKKELADI